MLNLKKYSLVLVVVSVVFATLFALFLPSIFYTVKEDDYSYFSIPFRVVLKEKVTEVKYVKIFSDTKVSRCVAKVSIVVSNQNSDDGVGILTGFVEPESDCENILTKRSPIFWYNNTTKEKVHQLSSGCDSIIKSVGSEVTEEKCAIKSLSPNIVFHFEN